MKKLLKVTCGLLIVLSSHRAFAIIGANQDATPPAATTNNGTSTGQRIGNIISAVVSTAFPAAQKVIDAIWPPGTNQNSGKKPNQVAAAIQPKTDDATLKAAQNASDLKAAASNLVVLRSFVTECGFASVQISSMQALLSGKSLSAMASDDDKAKLKYLWTPTQKRLSPLGSADMSTSVSIIDDNYIKGSLIAIQAAISSNLDNITNQIEAGRLADLNNSLAQLAPQVNGVSALTGLLIGDLSNSLKKAASDISSHAGPADPVDVVEKAKLDRANNLDLMKQVYKVDLK